MKSPASLFLTLAALFLAAPAAGANFAPETLIISAPSMIKGDNPEQGLRIPFTISGPAAIMFAVYTKEQALRVNGVRNGYLGWHYVDRIDTCVYLGAPKEYPAGTSFISWDCRDENGATIGMYYYTYYLIGWDDVSPRRKAIGHMSFPRFDRSIVMCRGADDRPLAQPVLYTSARRAESEGKAWNIRSRWILGGDPEDEALIETTRYSRSGTDYGAMALFPRDPRYFFTQSFKPGTLTSEMWEWVPNGEAILHTEWGNEGKVESPTIISGEPPAYSGPVSDMQDYLFFTNTGESGSQLGFLDVNDGTEIRRVDLAPWWGGAATPLSGPSAMRFQRGMLYLDSPWSCLVQAILPYAEEDAHFVQWVNGNGDGTGDKNFEPDSPNPWLCHDPGRPPFAGPLALDGNLFAAFPLESASAGSFGLFGPDGTGMGYFTLPGVRGGDISGMHLIDYGSPYDGLYCGGSAAEGDSAGIWFTPYDSIKGILDFGPCAAGSEDAPRPFVAVSNHPNPFNPATVIRYELGRPGRATLSVYSALGQRISRLDLGQKGRGAHEYRFDAEGLPSGVYFYRVETEAAAATGKMMVVR